MTTYAKSICEGFEYVLRNYNEAFVIGQGLWSPWYVGRTMDGLEKKFGKDRIIDTPVSESATTGIGVGAGLNGGKVIVVHPRMDFALYAMDSIVNQAAKWSYLFGTQNAPNVTIRMIINRGGEQGAQHSQALHSWFCHIPGLRVVMPYSSKDARDLLISSVIYPGPVIFIDDRWLYDEDEETGEPEIVDLRKVSPRLVSHGTDLTIVSSGYSSKLAISAANQAKCHGVSIDVIDLRQISQFCMEKIKTSLNKTRRLLVVDGGWASCGLSSEVIARVSEDDSIKALKTNPKRIALPFCPAPTAKSQETAYYPDTEMVLKAIYAMVY